MAFNCRGSIVLVASMSGMVANKGLKSSVYNSSKAAVIQLGQNLAMEWGSKGIRVNSLCPGHVITPTVEENFEEVPELKRIWENESMLGRLSRPEEFTGAIIFMLSNASSYMTGSTLVIDVRNNCGVSHIILAAIHINDEPGHLTLNDHPPDDPRYVPLWAEMRLMQAMEIKVMGMLGGAAQGSYQKLDGGSADFEAYYCPLRDMIRAHNLDGLDLDVEEEMSLEGIIRLIDRLKSDFGEGFIITLAPVATALVHGLEHLSGFDYRALEAARGSKISWYNVQFYNGWGQMLHVSVYDTIMLQGWKPEKVVIGLLTNPANGSRGYVPMETMSFVLASVLTKYPFFGGISGWEYFNAMPGGLARPWEWAASISMILGMRKILQAIDSKIAAAIPRPSSVKKSRSKKLRNDTGESGNRSESLRQHSSNARGEKPVSALRSLLTGIPSTTSRPASLATISVNIFLVVLSLDFVLRGLIFYSTKDLSFSRVGYVSSTTAKILVREPNKNLPIRVTYQEIGDGVLGRTVTTGTLYSLEESTDFTYPIKITGLKPSTKYRYSLSNSQSGVFVTAPEPGSSESKKVTFVTSSCIKANFPYSPFSHPFRIHGIDILTSTLEKLSSKVRPAFMLFLGDFIYIDVPWRFGSSVQHYRSEYRRVYSSPSWRIGPDSPANIPWIHTLDDHEIANDWASGNVTPPYPAAADPYLHYHVSVNPPIPEHSYSIPSNTTYFSFIHGPASFFLLDTRTYRSQPLRNDSTMLGSAQLHSLLEYISRPEPEGVKWKIITSSVPFTKNWHVGTPDTWGGFLKERRTIFETMWRAELELGVRVVLLSGDRHEFAATRFPDPILSSTSTPEAFSGAGRGVHEFCVGPLNQFYLPIRSYSQEDNEDVAIKYVPDGNFKFGLIDIDLDESGEQPTSYLTYSLYVDGKEVWKYKLSALLAATTGRALPSGEVIMDGTENWEEKLRKNAGEWAGYARQRSGWLGHASGRAWNGLLRGGRIDE
ncbi:chitinase/phosphodiesterase/alkaline phosphatase [Emydomyces testavorans]|uniref:Chitinase/phosphodiesterase/alkaline phosphatase n=1 Tax=Emydomyces testavorans TaxID=2070801 RepID=A0AAF0IGY2_9EURO|nr:chitinase/phosphodiesterase/alkaline phosphatase [Emydomyces testavorans]